MAAERDTATLGHDSARQAARSPSLTRPSTQGRRTSISKRSPSPIVTFQSAPLSPENGVKNITRKVIKRLEGLGHLEELEVDSPTPEDDEMEAEKALDALASRNGHGHANGNGNGNAVKAKVDYEIPRKVLHSSIGFLTTYLYISEGSVPRVVLVLWTALAVIVPADLLRFNSRRFASLYERFLGFLMRESERNSINGVVWYILGVNCVLALLPQDVATVAILILSWADTAASTFGRLYGSSTRKLPARLPLLGLPLAPRKSVAGFAAATITGALIAVGFWGFVAPLREGGAHLSWTWEGGVRNPDTGASLGGGGALGLLAISVFAGLVSGVAEALDLGSLDDNLTLPIISGGCLFGFLKLLGAASSWFSS